MSAKTAPPPPTSLYAPENKAVPEEEGKKTATMTKAMVAPHVRHLSLRHFLAWRIFLLITYIFSYKSPMTRAFMGMRETYARLRSTGWKRVIRRKEIVAIDAAEEAMDTTDANVIL